MPGQRPCHGGITSGIGVGGRDRGGVNVDGGNQGAMHLIDTGTAVTTPEVLTTVADARRTHRGLI